MKKELQLLDHSINVLKKPDEHPIEIIMCAMEHIRDFSFSEKNGQPVH